MKIHYRAGDWIIKKTVVFAVFFHKMTISTEKAIISYYRREDMLR